MPESAIYRTIWRWHFYAGLIVLPIIVVLSLSGALYLFKPQVERWEERSFQNLPIAGATAPSSQVAAAQAALPGAKLAFYRLPERPGDAAMIHFALPGHRGMRDVFVSPQGEVLGVLDPDSRIIAVDRKIHGQLLLGRMGSWLVELAASWAIVMILSGLYLWWPRGSRLAGVVWPRLRRGGRAFWRDLHAVTGFWVSGLALVLLFTGLPWTDAWGSAFKSIREEMGWMKGAQDWTLGGRSADEPVALHVGHDHAAMTHGIDAAPETGAGAPRHHIMGSATAFDPALFDRLVVNARHAGWAFPVLVIPPGAPAGDEGRGTPGQDWVVKSDAQNRPLRITLRYDADTGAPGRIESFSDQHPIDRVVAYGVAWHEGQLFGWVNQLIGLLTAIMMIVIAASGFVMWRRRKPVHALGAPPMARRPAWPTGIGFQLIAVFLLVVLPLFTASVVAIAVLDRFALPHLRGLANWLGMVPPGEEFAE